MSAATASRSASVPSSARTSHPTFRPFPVSVLSFLVLVLGLVLVPTVCHAAITLPTILSNNAILQREPAQPILYGWSTAALQSIVQIYLDDSPLTDGATIQSDGSWEYVMPAQPTSTVGHTLRFVDTASGLVVLTNVKFGDVILCGGQSNMEMTLHSALLFNETIAVVDQYPNLHLFAVQAQISSNATMAQTSNSQYPSRSWLVSSFNSTLYPDGPFNAWPRDWSYFSAVCYYTGKALYDASNGLVPIGLISGAYGGTIIEAWTSPQTVPQCQPYPYTYQGWAPPVPNSTSPGVIFAAMVHPLLKTQLSAVVWYQGESNGWLPERYGCAFPAFIQDWRQQFKQPSLPFVFVLLTPWTGFSPLMWTAQQQALALPNVYAVNTVDAMDYNPLYDGFLHPRNKSVVGDRAARWIRSKVWGQTSVATQGPVVSAVNATLDLYGVLHVSLTLAGGGGGTGSGSGSGYYTLSTPNCTACCMNGSGLVSARLAAGTTSYLPIVWLSGGQLSGLVSVSWSEASAWRASKQLLVELEWFTFPQCALYDATGLPAMPFSRPFPLTIEPGIPIAPSSSTGLPSPPSDGSSSAPPFLLALLLVFLVLAGVSSFCFVYCWSLRTHGRLCFCSCFDQCEGGCGRWCHETLGVGRGTAAAGSAGGGGGGGMKWGGGGSWRGMSDAELLKMVTTDRYD